MKTGIELIAQERQEQIEKHGRTVQDDIKYNHQQQLRVAAMRLLYSDASNAGYPTNWNPDIWKKMKSKDYEDRLIIAGALIAAELDRIRVEIDEIFSNPPMMPQDLPSEH